MTKSRNFSATYNNPEMTGQEWVDLLAAKGAVYAICQLERGENGTPHLQCAFGFKNQMQLKSMQKYLKNHHVEPSKNALAAYNYCKKEGAVEGPWIHGVPPAAKNVKGDTKERNQLILEHGAVKAVEDGLIPIEKFKQLRQSLELFQVMKKD